MLLELLKEALPDGNTLPATYNEMKKIFSGLGLGYEKIHACPNSCVLFWKDRENQQECDVCGASRWKESTVVVEDKGENFNSTKKKNIPAKVLRWFPLKPRLQRLFMCSKTASLMKWHEEGRTKDGLMRHPADSPAWKDLDSRHPEFSADPRNVRLGLASDGFNPFGMMTVSHSTWPVILIPYNLPPWLCMKQPNFILTLLISGPKSPGNKIDVYLQPLIEELKELWDEGLKTYDVSVNQSFIMRAVVLWTISDLPGLSSLSGYSARGMYACPYCGFDTESLWLVHSRKYCYMGHRRWLEADHIYRQDAQSFDGTCETRPAAMRLTGSEALRQLECIEDEYNNGSMQPWKRKSIFFQLPYWEHLLLRHNIDVMHTVKNIFDNTCGTITSQQGKSKDNYKARCDLEDMGIRNDLHPKVRLRTNTKYLPKACYQMTSKEKDAFFKVLKDLRAPDELSSNVSRCVQLKPHKLIGLKSHDCHVLMLELLPIALRKSLPDEVCSTIIDFCNYFKNICSKVLCERDLDLLEHRIAITLCEMEKIFPPSFFTIMVHLAIHLANEAKLGGPVNFRWMYPIERYNLNLFHVVLVFNISISNFKDY
ncbi:hypothetical protein SLE2022_283550 [Rubroshorea leprosula]